MDTASSLNTEQDFERWLLTLEEVRFENQMQQNPFTHSQRKKLFENEVFTDTVITAKALPSEDGNQSATNSINCHRFVLYENSSVFEAMLSSGFKESNGRIDIVGTKFSVLQKAISYLYTGDITLSSYEIIPVIEFADMYVITPLRDVCFEFLMKNICIDVALMLLKFAKKYRAAVYIEKITQYCLERFSEGKEQLSKSKSFVETDEYTIIELISHPGLKIKDETVAFDALFDWIAYDFANRATRTTDLIRRSIHVEKVEVQHILDKIANFGDQGLPDEMRLHLLSLMTTRSPNNCVSGNILPTRTATRVIECLYAMVIAPPAQFHGQVFSFDHTLKCVAVKTESDEYLNRALAGKTHIFFHGESIYRSETQPHVVLGPVQQMKRIHLLHHTDGPLYNGPAPQNMIFDTHGNIWMVNVLEYIEITKFCSTPPRGDTCKSMSKVPNAKLSTLYKDTIFFFHPEKERIITFNITSKRFGCVDIKLSTKTSDVVFSWFRNIAFLIKGKEIEVVDLHVLLEQITAQSKSTAGNLNVVQTTSRVIRTPKKYANICAATVCGNRLVLMHEPQEQASKRPECICCSTCDVTDVVNPTETMSWKELNIPLCPSDQEAFFKCGPSRQWSLATVSILNRTHWSSEQITQEHAEAQEAMLSNMMANMMANVTP